MSTKKNNRTSMVILQINIFFYRIRQIRDSGAYLSHLNLLIKPIRPCRRSFFNSCVEGFRKEFLRKKLSYLRYLRVKYHIDTLYQVSSTCGLGMYEIAFTSSLKPLKSQ